jgi:hypothetical protein
MKIMWALVLVMASATASAGFGSDQFCDGFELQTSGQIES